MIRISILLLLFAFLPGIEYSATAQQTNMEKTCLMEFDSWIFPSKHSAKNFKIYLRLPEGYHTSKDSYPVLYMTDGDWSMTDGVSTLNKLRQDYILHEPILVGIGYGTETNARSHDLNPDAGGEAFYQFIYQELMPFIKTTYRTNNDNTLYGYSIGGYFTNFVLFNHPTAFNRYLIGGLPVWYNFPRTPIKEAKKYFQSNDSLKADVFYGIGELEAPSLKEIQTLETYLKSIQFRGLNLVIRTIPDGGHATAFSKVMQDAFTHSFCETHKAIPTSKNDLLRHIGNYAYVNDSNSVIQVYMEKEKLYFKDAFYTSELKPFNKNAFFIPVFEIIDIVIVNDQLRVAYPGNPDRVYKKIKPIK